MLIWPYTVMSSLLILKRSFKKHIQHVFQQLTLSLLLKGTGNVFNVFSPYTKMVFAFSLTNLVGSTVLEIVIIIESILINLSVSEKLHHAFPMFFMH